MRILYAIAGTGNGHISRAREVLPHLKAFGDVDVLVSGGSPEVDVGAPIRFRPEGLTLAFDREGRLDPLKTARGLALRRFFADVHEFDVEKYDVVLNDFEPVTAWAAQWRGVPCISFSNQAAFLSPKVPRPPEGRSPVELLFRYYAPGSSAVGFHYERYDKAIRTPIIRRDVRALRPKDGGPVLVYLLLSPTPKVVKALAAVPDVRFELFLRPGEKVNAPKNVTVVPVSTEAFVKRLETASGIITGAGFGTTSEAIHLGKRLLVLPIRKHYEQECNAEALRRLNVPVVDELSALTPALIRSWLGRPSPKPRNYPDETAAVLRDILK